MTRNNVPPPAEVFCFQVKYVGVRPQLLSTELDRRWVRVSFKLDYVILGTYDLRLGLSSV